MKKKLLSLLLSLCMICSACVTLGVTAFADGEATPTPLTDTAIAAVVTAGSGTIELNSAADAATLAKYMNDNDATLAGITVQLNTDITVNPGMNALEITSTTDVSALEKWTPIKKFEGTLDGGNHTIRGLYISGQGFITELVGSAIVRDLTFDNCYLTITYMKAGMLAGATPAGATVQVSNVDVTNSNIYSSIPSAIGGIIGDSTGTVEIDNCTVSGKISCDYAQDTNDNRVGGIIGRVNTQGPDSKITNCTNNATINVVGQTGGIMGNNRGKNVLFENCVNNGNITNESTVQVTNSHAGGILAYLSHGSAAIKNCINNGSISLRCYSANCSSSGCAAGIVATADVPVTVENCINYKPVSSNGLYAGGIGAKYGNNADNSYVKNTVNFGNVTLTLAEKTSAVAGIMAFTTTDVAVTISNCVNFGKVDSSTATYSLSYAGGFVGNSEDILNVTNCANYGDVYGRTRAGGLVGCYEMQTTASFVNCITTAKVHTEGNDYGNGAFIGHFKKANTDASKYLTFENCYYLAGSSYYRNANAAEDAEWTLCAHNAALTIKEEGDQTSGKGNIRVVYKATGVDFTFLGGTHNLPTDTQTGAVGYQNLYNSVFTGTLNENIPEETNYNTGAMLDSIEALQGAVGAANLGRAGYDMGGVWFVTGTLPVPTELALEAGELDEAAAVVYKGYQKKLNTIGDTMGVRLIAGLQSLSYANTGYEVSTVATVYNASTGAVESVTAKQSENALTTEVVYTQLNAYVEDGSGTLDDPIVASDLGCAYLSAITVNDLPAAENTTVSLVIKPFVTGADNQRSYGSTIVLMIENGVVVSQYVA